MEVQAFRRGGYLAETSVIETALGQLAQEEAEALAESPLPPDPGSWFPHLVDEHAADE